MFGLCLANIDKLTYNKTYQFPRWSEALGWSMAASALMAIPAYAVYKIYVTPGPLTQVRKRYNLQNKLRQPEQRCFFQTSKFLFQIKHNLQ